MSNRIRIFAISKEGAWHTWSWQQVGRPGWEWHLPHLPRGYSAKVERICASSRSGWTFELHTPGNGCFSGAPGGLKAAQEWAEHVLARVMDQRASRKAASK